jgi:hypothetical protein
VALLVLVRMMAVFADHKKRTTGKFFSALPRQLSIFVGHRLAI